MLLQLRNSIPLVTLILLAFFLRFPSFFEPYWYGDELIRLTVAKEWLFGKTLYEEIFDNSPPALYLIFGLAANIFWLKVLSFLFLIIAVTAFYFLAQKLKQAGNLPKIYPVLATVIFVLLTATPIFEGNIATAEVFILAPVISAMLLIWKVNNEKRVVLGCIAGAVFALATLIRIQAATDLAAAIAFLIIFKKLVLITALLLPFLAIWMITFGAFFITNTWQSFISSVFFGNFDYLNFSNQLIIPFGLLILKFVVLVVILAIIFHFRKSLKKFEIFIIIWLIFSFLGASIGGRGFPHYLIQLTPAASLIIALLIKRQVADFAKVLILLTVFALFFVLGGFYIPRTFSYYANFFNLFTDYEKYKNWFDLKVSQSGTIANYIAAKTDKNDKIFVLGNAPEIYLLSKRQTLGNYVVSYHLNFQRDAKIKTLEAFVKDPPKIVISFKEDEEELPQLFPFLSKNYTKTIKIGQGQIWERRF